MKESYPIYISKDEDCYLVDIPDFAVNTEGTSFDDAMFMAKDALEMVIESIKDMGLEMPKPNTFKYEPFGVVRYIEVDI